MSTAGFEANDLVLLDRWFPVIWWALTLQLKRLYCTLRTYRINFVPRHTVPVRSALNKQRGSLELIDEAMRDL